MSEKPKYDILQEDFFKISVSVQGSTENLKFRVGLHIEAHPAASSMPERLKFSIAKSLNKLAIAILEDDLEKWSTDNKETK